MDWRLLGFVISAGVLSRFAFLWLKWRRAPQRREGQLSESWSLATLVIASFATLFAELALIRWIGTEVRVFAYVKNLALLLCFMGFGLGCALVRRPVRWVASVSALLGLVMLVRQPWTRARLPESLSRSLGGGQDIQIWATEAVRNWPNFLAAAAVTGLLLFLIACIFVPLGQIVSRQLELAADSLRGYSWNLAASLAGILAFFAISWLGLAPGIWFGIILLGMALLQREAGQRILFTILVVPAALMLHDTSTPLRFNLWTPYQELQVQQQSFPGGEFRRTLIGVNHTGYQQIINLSPDFLARHPGLMTESPDENDYNLPFRFTPADPRVLIVGSGTGNDVAAAVRNHSRSVDAVEIDPSILKLGARHPEHPYSSNVVTAHLADARSFMKRASGPYDLVLFGLLDSHTLADYSNMRIDSFVYTEESLREAKSLLAPRGVLFIKFQVDRDWIVSRLTEMLRDVFGKPPLVLTVESSYSWGATCFVISPSGQVEDRVMADPRLQQFIARSRRISPDVDRVAVTTDDWPYLYQEGHWLPSIFLSVSFLVLLVAVGFYWQIPEARRRAPSLFFFSMGAAFLLLETQVISRLALYFGTTWQVNGIVIAAILVALLLANTIVEKQKQPWPVWCDVAGLLGGIAFAYFVPFSRIPGSAMFVGLVASTTFAIPVFFAGLLFATKFRTVDSPSAALGANMLGAVAGGLLENLSLIIGLRALLLVAMGLYVVASLGLCSRWKNLAWMKDASV
jgi:spermidine synthase